MVIENTALRIHALIQRRGSNDTAGTVKRILYCHGFASNFDPEKEKVRALSTLAPVDGVTVDYTFPPEGLFSVFSNAIVSPKSTLIIGTSMGGFFAAWLGSKLNLPFIAINPAIAPAKALQKYVGEGHTHLGIPFFLSQEVVNAYTDLQFRLDGDGTVVLNLGDQVIDPHETIKTIDDRCPLITFSGGSHRFDHINALLPLIRDRFFKLAQ